MKLPLLNAYKYLVWSVAFIDLELFNMDHSNRASTSNPLTSTNHDFDSISMCSYPSTVYDSDYVAAGIASHNNNIALSSQNMPSLASPNNQMINLNINVINNSEKLYFLNYFISSTFRSKLIFAMTNFNRKSSTSIEKYFSFQLAQQQEITKARQKRSTKYWQNFQIQLIRKKNRFGNQNLT